MPPRFQFDCREKSCYLNPTDEDKEFCKNNGWEGCDPRSYIDNKGVKWSNQKWEIPKPGGNSTIAVGSLWETNAIITNDIIMDRIR